MTIPTDPNNAHFDLLYDAHADWLFRLCLRLCGYCHAEAEDLAQEVLVAVFQSLPRFAGRARLTTWMYAVAIRTRRKHLSRRPPASVSLSTANGSAAPTTELEDRLTRIGVEAALIALPDTLRESFVLVKAEGLTHKEAAHLLGIPMGTVQARVHEAARRLRIALSEEENQ
ncbi:MAG: RNA polymerase sigma factor [Akkermansiaceae bacterium]|nr:RNA polymerase sigma factor [Armatimonadota bacterium]